MKSALITGITGQDGAYLAQLLIAKGYQVHGGFRRTSSVNFWRLESLGILNHPRLKLSEFDLTDPASCMTLVSNAKPQEIYNLAAQSFVGVSFTQPSSTGAITGIGALNMLEAIRIIDPSIRFTRPRPLKCSARYKLCRNPRRRLSIRAAHMALPNFTRTG